MEVGRLCEAFSLSTLQVLPDSGDVINPAGVVNEVQVDIVESKLRADKHQAHIA